MERIDICWVRGWAKNKKSNFREEKRGI